jgi:hypothetical protein
VLNGRLRVPFASSWRRAALAAPVEQQAAATREIVASVQTVTTATQESTQAMQESTDAASGMVTAGAMRSYEMPIRCGSPAI